LLEKLAAEIERIRAAEALFRDVWLTWQKNISDHFCCHISSLEK